MNFSKKKLLIVLFFISIMSFSHSKNPDYDMFDSYSRFDRLAELKGMKIIARVKNAQALQDMLTKTKDAQDKIEARIAELEKDGGGKIKLDDKIESLKAKHFSLDLDIKRLAKDQEGQNKIVDQNGGAGKDETLGKLSEIVSKASGFEKEIKEKERELNKLNEEIEKLSKRKNDGEVFYQVQDDESLRKELDGLMETKKYQGKILKDLKIALGQALKKPGMGDVVMKGIAGKDAGDSLDEIIIGEGESGWSEEGKLMLKGAGYGILFRTSNSVGKELGNSIDQMVKGSFNSSTGVIIHFFRYLNNLILHGGNVPFEIYEVDIWKSLVVNDMRSMEKMLKEGGKDASRSRDMIAREMDEDDEEKPTEKQIRLIWKDFSDAFAEECMQMVEEIKQRKKYYKKSDLIVFYSTQLQKRLLGLAQLVLKMNSLKDFSTLGEINTVFPSLTKNVEKLFVVLTNQIKASQFSFDKNKKLSSSLGSSSYSPGDGYNDYPHSAEF
ncbi:MAG: hypothetical protein ABIA74_02430 [bacterium]